NLESEFQQSFTSSAMHACSFLTVTHGGDGEPEILVLPHAADESTALWDTRRRTLSAFLAVTSWDAGSRSEEHTSELQSRFDLVCRLLLEKKKQYLSDAVMTSAHIPL